MIDVAVVLDVVVELPLLELVLVIELGVRLWVDEITDVVMLVMVVTVVVTTVVVATTRFTSLVSLVAELVITSVVVEAVRPLLVISSVVTVVPPVVAVMEPVILPAVEVVLVILVILVTLLVVTVRVVVIWVVLTVVAGNIVSVILPVVVTEVLTVLDVNVVTLLRSDASASRVLKIGATVFCKDSGQRFEALDSLLVVATTKDAISFKDACSFCVMLCSVSSLNLDVTESVEDVSVAPDQKHVEFNRIAHLCTHFLQPPVQCVTRRPHHKSTFVAVTSTSASKDFLAILR